MGNFIKNYCGFLLMGLAICIAMASTIPLFFSNIEFTADQAGWIAATFSVFYMAGLILQVEIFERKLRK